MYSLGTAKVSFSNGYTKLKSPEIQASPNIGQLCECRDLISEDSDRMKPYKPNECWNSYDMV